LDGTPHLTKLATVAIATGTTAILNVEAKRSEAIGFIGLGAGEQLKPRTRKTMVGSYLGLLTEEGRTEEPQQAWLITFTGVLSTARLVIILFW
jgi:hypothetical protein